MPFFEPSFLPTSREEFVDPSRTLPNHLCSLCSAAARSSSTPARVPGLRKGSGLRPTAQGPGHRHPLCPGSGPILPPHASTNMAAPVSWTRKPALKRKFLNWTRSPTTAMAYVAECVSQKVFVINAQREASTCCWHGWIAKCDGVGGYRWQCIVQRLGASQMCFICGMTSLKSRKPRCAQNFTEWAACSFDLSPTTSFEFSDED